MELRIVRPDGEKKFSIAWIEVETPEGNFVIHGGHAPTLLTLLPHHDIFFQLKTGQRESMLVANGIIEITRERATIIINE